MVHRGDRRERGGICPFVFSSTSRRGLGFVTMQIFVHEAESPNSLVGLVSAVFLSPFSAHSAVNPPFPVIGYDS